MTVTETKMKPEQWPENPYFESAMSSIKSDADYAKAISDPKLRTAISWYLSNRVWELASTAIFEAIQDNGDGLPDHPVLIAQNKQAFALLYDALQEVKSIIQRGIREGERGHKKALHDAMKILNEVT